MSELFKKSMTRRGFISKAALAGGLAATGAAGWSMAASNKALAAEKAQGPLEISNWPYFISPKTVPAFEKKYGIKVDYIEDINGMNQIFGKIAGSLQTGHNPNRDMIIIDNWLVARLMELGWLEKIDHSKIANLKHLYPRFRNADWDPHRQYSLPWAGFMTGIGYNVKKTGGEVDSISALFDPKYKGHVGILNDMRSTLSTIFLSMGVDPKDATYKDVKKAVAIIEKNINNGQFRQVYGNDYVSALSRGDIWVTIAWSGDLVQLNEPNFKFAFPKEGGWASEDNMVVLKKAPHYDAAMEWIDFIYDPKVYAQIAAYIKYIPPISGTKQYLKKLSPRLVDNVLIFPSQAMIKRSHEFKELSASEDGKWESAFQQAIGH